MPDDKTSLVTLPSDMSGAHHTHHTDDISSSTAHTKTQTNSEFKTYLLAIGVSEAKSQEGRKFFYRLTMGYLINILPADFNSITG